MELILTPALLALVPVIIALTEAVKRIFVLPERLAPVVSMVFGVSGAFVPIFGVDADLLTTVYYGLIVGLSASGIYDVGKRSVLGA